MRWAFFFSPHATPHTARRALSSGQSERPKGNARGISNAPDMRHLRSTSASHAALRVAGALIVVAASFGAAGVPAHAFATKTIATPDGLCSVAIPAGWTTSVRGQKVTADTGNANVLFTLDHEYGIFHPAVIDLSGKKSTKKSIVEDVGYDDYVKADWEPPQNGNATPPLDVMTGVAAKRDSSGEVRGACVVRYVVRHWSKMRASVYPVNRALRVNAAFP